MTVLSNDPEKPRFDLNISATIEQLAGFQPPRVDLGKVLIGGTATGVAHITAKDPAALHLEGLTSPDPALAVKLIEDGGRPAVQLSFTAPSKPGRFATRVTAKTGIPAAPEIALQVSATVSADLVVDRPFVQFAPIQEGQPSPQAQIKVTSLTGKPFKLRKVEDATGSVEGSIQPADGGGFTVVLKLKKTLTTPRGTLSITTDRADQPALEVSFGVRPPPRPPMKAGAMPPPRPKLPVPQAPAPH